jgi:hypothetical protein
VLVASVAAPVVAQGIDVTGTWVLTFNTAQGPVAAQMILKKDGDKIFGTISSELGEAELDAAVKEKAVTVAFAMPAPGGGGSMNVTLNASVDGNTIKGTYDLNGQGGGDFSGTRDAKDSKDAKDAKDQSKEPPKDQPKIDVTGTWSVQVVTSAISASPTVTLKQDGEKITGQYISAQYGEFPLTGTLKGNKIDFGFSMNIEGNALNVAYSGTVDGDGMKGTVNYGDLADGTFTASRKK